MMARDSSYYPGNTIRRPSRFLGLSPNLIISAATVFADEFEQLLQRSGWIQGNTIRRPSRFQGLNHNLIISPATVSKIMMDSSY